MSKVLFGTIIAKCSPQSPGIALAEDGQERLFAIGHQREAHVRIKEGGEYRVDFRNHLANDRCLQLGERVCLKPSATDPDLVSVIGPIPQRLKHQLDHSPANHKKRPKNPAHIGRPRHLIRLVG